MATQTKVKSKSSSTPEAPRAVTPALGTRWPQRRRHRHRLERRARGSRPYDQALLQGEDLRRRPYAAATTVQILRQHAKAA